MNKPISIVSLYLLLIIFGHSLFATEKTSDAPADWEEFKTQLGAQRLLALQHRLNELNQDIAH